MIVTSVRSENLSVPEIVGTSLALGVVISRLPAAKIVSSDPTALT